MSKNYVKLAAQEFLAFARKWPDIGMCPTTYRSPIGEIAVAWSACGKYIVVLVKGGAPEIYTPADLE